VDPAAVGAASMRIANQLQNFDAETQLAAIGVAFTLLLEKYQVGAAGNILEVSRNILHRTRGSESAELRGAVGYINGEL
jgi:hypothetical protein